MAAVAGALGRDQHQGTGAVGLEAAVEETEGLDDAGRGMGERGTGGNGIRNLTTRANELGGTFEVADRPGGGTSVRWRIPILD